jgi:hypothetical protein
MNKFNNIIGFDKIKFLVADREFIGKYWLEYLNQHQIKYHIRIRENFDVFLPKKGVMDIFNGFLETYVSNGQN